jgi:hypothetical protein
MPRDHHPPLRDVTADTEKTVSSMLPNIATDCLPRIGLRANFFYGAVA